MLAMSFFCLEFLPSWMKVILKITDFFPGWEAFRCQPGGHIVDGSFHHHGRIILVWNGQASPVSSNHKKEIKNIKTSIILKFIFARTEAKIGSLFYFYAILTNKRHMAYLANWSNMNNWKEQLINVHFLAIYFNLWKRHQQTILTI